MDKEHEIRIKLRERTRDRERGMSLLALQRGILMQKPFYVAQKATSIVILADLIFL